MPEPIRIAVLSEHITPPEGERACEQNDDVQTERCNLTRTGGAATIAGIGAEMVEPVGRSGEQWHLLTS